MPSNPQGLRQLQIGPWPAEGEAYKGFKTFIQELQLAIPAKNTATISVTGTESPLPGQLWLVTSATTRLYAKYEARSTYILPSKLREAYEHKLTAANEQDTNATAAYEAGGKTNALAIQIHEAQQGIYLAESEREQALIAGATAALEATQGGLTLELVLRTPGTRPVFIPLQLDVKIGNLLNVVEQSAERMTISREYTVQAVSTQQFIAPLLITSGQQVAADLVMGYSGITNYVNVQWIRVAFPESFLNYETVKEPY
jgi:hypothetical protein